MRGSPTALLPTSTSLSQHKSTIAMPVPRPPAWERALHPRRTARLSIRDDLRDLRPLLHQRGPPQDLDRPGRQRREPRRARPCEGLYRTAHQAGFTRCLTPITRISRGFSQENVLVCQSGDLFPHLEDVVAVPVGSPAVRAGAGAGGAGGFLSQPTATGVTGLAVPPVIFSAPMVSRNS